MQFPLLSTPLSSITLSHPALVFVSSSLNRLIFKMVQCPSIIAPLTESMGKKNMNIKRKALWHLVSQFPKLRFIEYDYGRRQRWICRNSNANRNAFERLNDDEPLKLNWIFFSFAMKMIEMKSKMVLKCVFVAFDELDIERFLWILKSAYAIELE